jgi:hypothetical protein
MASTTQTSQGAAQLRQLRLADQGYQRAIPLGSVQNVDCEIAEPLTIRPSGRLGSLRRQRVSEQEHSPGLEGQDSLAQADLRPPADVEIRPNSPAEAWLDVSGATMVLAELGQFSAEPQGTLNAGSFDAASAQTAGAAAAGGTFAAPWASAGGLGATLGLGGVAIAQAAGGNTSSGPSEAPRAIRVADGYIQGARIYLKTPGGLKILEGVLTDALGQFYLPAGANPQGYPIVARGGINTDTGLPQTTSLQSPAGSTMVNPLTTVVQNLLDAQQALTPKQAAAMVAGALGLLLPPGIDVLDYDPLQLGDVAVQAHAASIANLMNMASDGGAAALQKLALTIFGHTPGAPAIDLSDPAVIVDLLQGTSDDMDLDNDGAADQNLSLLKELRAANQAISGAATLADISSAQRVASQMEAQGVDLVSLSGGGWKALSADAGLMAGMLKYFDSIGSGAGSRIKDLWRSELTISANSGSTWFLDLLAFDPDFVSALEHSGAGDSAFYGNLFAPGKYMGIMGANYERYFSVTPDTTLAWVIGALDAVTRTVTLGLYSSFADLLGDLLGVADPQSYFGVVDLILNRDQPSWIDFVSQVVFGHPGTEALMKSIDFLTSDDTRIAGLQSARTDALAKQTLLYAMGLAAEKAVIHTSDTDANLIWASVTPQLANGSPVSSTIDNFIPAIAGSLVVDTVAVPALPTIASGDIGVTYGQAYGSATASTILENLNFNGLTAFDASAASSSAAGILNSLGVLQHALGSNNWWDLLHIVDTASQQFVTYLQDMAPLVATDRLSRSTFAATGALLPPADLTLQNAADQGYLRLVDGGYIDNSSLTSGMAYLLKKLGASDLDGFDVTQVVYTSHDETSRTNASYFGSADYSGPLDMSRYAQIGDTALKLFTGSDQAQNFREGFLSVDTSHPGTEIFDASKTTGLEAPVWQWFDDRSDADPADDFKLQYFKLGVTTADTSATWGMGSGLSGTLNLWVVSDPTMAIPLMTGHIGWSGYERMYDDIVTALNADYGEGALLLAHTLGGAAVLAA